MHVCVCVCVCVLFLENTHVRACVCVCVLSTCMHVLCVDMSVYTQVQILDACVCAPLALRLRNEWAL